jgi:AbrB family looped-hinge helix DNA binding protein
MEFEIAKIGERGQIVIPQSFREDMSIHKGDKFMILQRGDVLVLKKLRAPSMEDFEKMIKKSHAHAKKHGLTKKTWKQLLKEHEKNEGCFRY